MAAEHHRMSEVADSDWAKFAGRVFTPALLLLSSILLGVLTASIGGVRTDQITTTSKLGDLQVDVSALNTKVDWALMQRIVSLEDRVRTLEAKHSK